MATRINYQLEMERVLHREAGHTPRLLLHCCCAPCASFVLESLAPHFCIRAHYDNPNIDSAEEYARRAGELQRLAAQMPLANAVSVAVVAYAPAEF